MVAVAMVVNIRLRGAPEKSVTRQQRSQQTEASQARAPVLSPTSWASREW